MFAGTLTTGGVVSTTVTVTLALPVLPCASVALQVTVVVAIGKVVPEAGLQLAVTAPRSEARRVGKELAAAPPGPAASLVMFAGTLTTGGVVSTTVTVKLALPVL